MCRPTHFAKKIMQGLTLLLTSAIAARNAAKNSLDRVVQDNNDLNDITTKCAKLRDVRDTYDVVIVGAGPAGAVAAYYLGKQGHRVGICDKSFIGKSKACGGLWFPSALDILDDIGVLAQLQTEGHVREVNKSGFMSAMGHDTFCCNKDVSESEMRSSSGVRKTSTIKRSAVDKAIMQKLASIPSIKIFEATEVLDAKFNQSESIREDIPAGHWKLSLKSAKEGSFEVATTILLLCDGANSLLARKLKIIPDTDPKAFFSYSYVRGSTHNWKDHDAAVLYTAAMSPGYTMMLRHTNDNIYLGTYVLPEGRATYLSIGPFEADAIREHPYISAAFGDAFEFEEKRDVARVRNEAIAKPYSHQVLLIGDAAGQIDPMLGTGLHYAMKAAKIAANCVDEMFKRKNFSLEACRSYGLICSDMFSQEFTFSKYLVNFFAKFPFAFDTLAVMCQSNAELFECLRDIAFSSRSKYDLLTSPNFLSTFSIELIRQYYRQKITNEIPKIPQHIGMDSVDKYAGGKRR